MTMTPHFDALIYASALGVACFLLHPLDQQPWFVWVPALGVIAAVLAHFLLDLWSFTAVETWFDLLLGFLLFWCGASLRLVIAGKRGRLESPKPPRYGGSATGTLESAAA